MKLREIFRYELQYHLRSGPTWAYAVFLFLVAVWMFLATADGSGFNNAPERIAGGSVLPGMFGMLITAALFGSAAVRDIRYGMDPLIYTSPLKKIEYLGGRFLGALTINAIILLAIPLGIIAATVLLTQFDSDPLGPFRLAANLQPYFLFLLPNLIFVSSILFTLGALSRNVVPVYLGAIVVFIGYIVALNYANQIDSAILAMLVDPLGLVTLEGVTKYWTEAERNTRLIGLPTMLAWNRIFWLMIGGTVLVLLHYTFRFSHPGGSSRRRSKSIEVAPQSERVRAIEVPRVTGTFNFLTTVRQTFAVARNALAEVAGSRWFTVVLLACVGLPLLWGWNVGETVFDTSTWPITLLITEEVLGGRSIPLFIVLTLLYAGEFVWKNREVGVAEIADVAPVSNGIVLLGRFLALAGMVLIFQVASMFGGLLIQMLQGYYHFEPGLYLRVVFGILFPSYLLLGALAMTIHVLVNHKNLGHMIVVMVLGFIAIGFPLLGINHHLLLYGTDPGWTYSDMNGFGPFAEPVIWFKLYWGAWALLLLVFAVLFQVRGCESGIRNRLLQARDRFTGTTVKVTGVAVTLILLVGGFIYYNTNILNEYRSSAEQGLSQAEYEKRYKQYEDVKQPTITAATLHVEIYPDESTVDLRGSYHLVNQTGSGIDSIHVFTNPNIEARSLSLDRSSEAVLIDEEVGYRIYTLEQPLEPGASVELAFDVSFRPVGFPNSGIQTDVVSNGTSFNRMLMPFIGYQTVLELTNEKTREKFGLEPQPASPAPEKAAEKEHRWGISDADLVHVNAIIGTADDQTAVTSGVLRRSWKENGRSYFHYETETPIAFGGSIFSAEYEVLEDQWNDITLRIFHHPSHDANLDRMVSGMKASLEYFTEQFGPYPYSNLNIVEIPRYGGYGSAHPHMIAFTEDVFFSRVREGQVDQPFYGTAHEVAHTWWGGLVRGAPVSGASFLSESIANYSAMLVTEKTYGAKAGRRIYDFQMERYLLGRATQSREVPVLEVEDQPYIAYRKGALGLYLLRDHIGEAAVNGALRNYFEKYNKTEPPYPASLDLYAELQAATPDSLHSLLTDWFETITLWDVSTERVVVSQADTGDYVVTMDVFAKKMQADGKGNETEIPMNDLVEIGIFAPGEGTSLGEALYLEWHRIQSGKQTIRITVPQEPGRAGIDPWRKLIDRQREDNIIDVELDYSSNQ